MKSWLNLLLEAKNYFWSIYESLNLGDVICLKDIVVIDPFCLFHAHLISVLFCKPIN